MRKLLLFTVVLLSGCASDLTKYPEYNVAVPETKARLYIERANEYDKDPKEYPAVQQAWQKYFIKSNERDADFVLKETAIDYSLPAVGYLSIVTLGVIPFWGKEYFTYSYSLTRKETNRTFMLSDVHMTLRSYVGWLMIPALFSPNVRYDNGWEVEPATISALKEAASLIYDKNSKIYQQTKRKNWGAPVAEEQEAQTVAEPETSTPARQTLPVKQARPEEMDMLW